MISFLIWPCCIFTKDKFYPFDANNKLLNIQKHCEKYQNTDQIIVMKIALIIINVQTK